MVGTDGAYGATRGSTMGTAHRKGHAPLSPYAISMGNTALAKLRGSFTALVSFLPAYAHDTRCLEAGHTRDALTLLTGSISYCLRACYAMSGTGLGGSTPTIHTPSTGLGYAPTTHVQYLPRLCSYQDTRAVICISGTIQAISAICLRARYAIPCTDLTYYASRGDGYGA
eukprot:202447-Rhodomonas_salina.1